MLDLFVVKLCEITLFQNYFTLFQSVNTHSELCWLASLNCTEINGIDWLINSFSIQWFFLWTMFKYGYRLQSCTVFSYQFDSAVWMFRCINTRWLCWKPFYILVGILINSLKDLRISAFMVFFSLLKMLGKVQEFFSNIRILHIFHMFHLENSFWKTVLFWL